MNTLRTCITSAALILAGAALAQQTPEQTQKQEPAPHPAEETADQPRQGTQTQQQEPAPHPAQETADQPGQGTQTQESETRMPRGTPSTGVGEGTAADRTPPGETPTGVPGSPADPGTAQIVGSPVVSTEGDQVGSIVDVVFGAKGQEPEFAVVSRKEDDQMAAVPFSTMRFAKKGDKLVIDESRLRDAPKLEQGEWRDESGDWKREAMEYWGTGG